MKTEKDTLSLVNPRWPEAQWDISGAFCNDKQILAFHDFFVNVFHYKPFNLVHGSPLFDWNSGRVKLNLSCDVEQIKSAGLAYAERGIAIDYTFTNTLLTKEDLKNQLGNALLKFATKQNPTKENGIIMASDHLYAHVKTNFPELKTVSSILKVSTEKGKGKLDYYRALADKYDKVMIHPDDTFNFKLLEQLENKHQFELIINEYCIRNCPIRHLHYKSLSQSALNFFGHEDEFEKTRRGNGCSSLNVLLNSTTKNVSALNTAEIEQLYQMGFRVFKMQGRGMTNASGILFDLLRLLLNSERDDAIILTRLKRQFLESLV